MKTRSGQSVSVQIGVFYPITDLGTKNFKLPRPFQIKNDGEEDIFLEVTGSGMATGTFIKTKFPGGGTWSPEIIKEIKQNPEHEGAELIWGY